MRSTSSPEPSGRSPAAYGTYTVVRPHSLAATPAWLTPARPASRATRNLGWAIGASDHRLGCAPMLLAPPGTPLRAALAVRVACDAGDAIGFGVAVPPSSRAKVIAVAAGWGLICAAGFPAAGSRS